ncbi:MAG: GGDEF domain-containing protein [Chloroflexi bacterium]|nr:MAG: GGDEF domain-containing protein [Chloroflexota bacterium]
MAGLNQTQHRLPQATVTLLGVIAAWLIFTGLMFLVSRYNYLLFHNLAELFSIAVAVAVFMLAWNTRRFVNNDFLLLIGTSFLFAGFIDLFHTLSYKGMEVIASDDANLPTQLWIAARYLQSLSLLAAVLLIRRRIKKRLLLSVMTAVTALLLASIATGIFPDCYVNGLTPFKKVSEYIISLIFAAAALRLGRESEAFSPRVLALIRLSLVFMIGAELTFTFYIDVYGVSNFLGHIFKILAVYCIYKCVIETGLNQPFDLLFHGMKKRELELEESHKLLQEIAHRDQLTGLPNRLLFETRLTHALEKAQRENYAGQKRIVQVIIMDVDDFKGINDRLGHLGGDEVLLEIGRRLRAEIRESDTVARWGGDEFTCILEDLSGPDIAEHMAQKILTSMTEPVEVQDQIVSVTVSLGYSLYPIHSEKKADLLRYADMALYRAKGTKKSFRVYDGAVSRFDRSTD